MRDTLVGRLDDKDPMAAVQSVERAFTILRALAVGPAGVTELAERIELPKSTVARLLSALADEDAVAQDTAGGEYRLGEGLIDLVGAVRTGRSLVAAARPFLQDLAHSVGETAGVSILDGGQVYYLDHVDLDSDVQVRDWTGEYAPLHLVPSGLVHLAHWGDAAIKVFIAAGLESSTVNSVTDPEVLRERLQQVRTAGYAWAYEELIDGINSAAAPVFDHQGKVIAALHVHGPAYRFPDPERTHDVGRLLVEAADGLRVQLTEA
jgi:DNA-binding IclR family transcriptional regulator